MRALVIRTRMAMVEPAYSYDVYVPEAECPEHVRQACPGGTYYTRIGRGDGAGYYLDYEHATISPWHENLPQGLERWASWKEHERVARGRMLGLIRSVFSEMRDYAGDQAPLLWVTLPGTDLPHAEVWVQYP